MNEPRLSVVVPVFNRPTELRRALSSVAAQTMGDFECIVVDDASDDSIEPVVVDFGERFRYARREHNGGCSVTRLDGFRCCTGKYATTLDSDNELYPWAFERALALLDERSSVDCVTGLYVFEDGLRVRVGGGERLVTPSEYSASSVGGGADCLGVVRARVVQRWLSRRVDYFNLDFQMWFAMSLEFNQLYVDEPWAVFHEDGAHRISESPDPRQYVDRAKFVEAFRPVLGTRPCRPLDEFLQQSWVFLWRAKRNQEAAVVASWMKERGLSQRRAVAAFGLRKVQRRVAGSGPKLM
jgi:glycosyltransferase involved in cell wall biosynthesis